jgi:hypothetical protein
MSPYSDSELAFLFEATTKIIELTHEESKKLRSDSLRRDLNSISEKNRLAKQYDSRC